MKSNDAPNWKPITEQELAEVEIEQLRDLLRLTPTERLIRHEGARQLVVQLQAAGKAYYGFDPSTATQTTRRAS